MTTTVARGGSLTDDLVATSVWSDRRVAEAGLRVVDVPFVGVGGGLGTFQMIDYLRIAGLPTSTMKVLTVLDYPWQNYEYLTGVSQIPPQKRLRSDSASTPDNIWAFPSYAFREAFAADSVTGFLAPLWSVLTENVLCDYWTPKAGQMFAALQRERERIGYDECVVVGAVTMVRRRREGGYFVVHYPRGERNATNGQAPAPILYRCQYVHLAVGYPGLRFLPDLQKYREAYGDHHRVVNAYEPHEHVYDELNRRGGTVLIRGGGITSSQILDRLITDRDHLGSQTQILHLFRTYVDGAHGPSWFLRRRGGYGWAYQGFNWPKSTWGGAHKNRLRKLEGTERAQFLHILGGTTTARRHRWQNQLRRGRAEGWYRPAAGEVEDVVPGSLGTVVTRVRPMDGGDLVELPANFVIDATGLEADIAEHTTLADLLTHGGAHRNPLGRLDVERNFEVRGTRSGPGKMYAVGAATLGGYHAGVDTFLGLQYAALEVCDDLAHRGFCSYIGVRRSTAQWWKWMRNYRP